MLKTDDSSSTAASNAPRIEIKCCPQWLLTGIVENMMILFLQHTWKEQRDSFCCRDLHKGLP